MNDIKPGDIKQSLEAIKKLCTGDFNYETVLDVGSGEGLHADAFLYYEKKVTAVDFGTSKYYLKRKLANKEAKLINLKKNYLDGKINAREYKVNTNPVSYTHLTLPTKA